MQKHFSKTFILTIFLLITIGLALSACRPPNPDDREGLQLNNLTNLETESNQPLDLVEEGINMQTNESGKTIKTLEDFLPNPAQTATLVTTQGNIKIELFREQTPLTTANFVDLAASGFYDDIVFHRVIEDFMAQVGDPITKEPGKEAMWGTGSPGYTIADEFDPSLKHDSAGIVSMANAGPNTGGSQFFIIHGPTPHLDGLHSVFGKVTDGMDVLYKIDIGDKILSISLE